MFHLQQTHFGKTKLLKFFINKSVEGKIQSQHQYVDIGAYRIYFEDYDKYPTKPKNEDILRYR